MFNIEMTTNLWNEKICSIHSSHSRPRMPFLNQESRLDLGGIEGVLLINAVENVSSMLDTLIYLLSTWLMSQTCTTGLNIPSISHRIPSWQISIPCLCLVRGLRSLFSNIAVYVMLSMDLFNSWLHFHCQRHLVTLFGYDTTQFRQCGIFIHNNEAIQVPVIEPKTSNVLHRFFLLYFSLISKLLS